MKRYPAVLLALTLALASAENAAAQAKSLQQFQVDDLKELKSQFVSLATIFPQDQWDWRPMEVAAGLTPVRSPREVLILITNEGNAFPTMWGAPPVAGVLTERGAEAARLQAMSKPELVAAAGKAFDNIIAVVQGMDEATRAKEIRMFGQPARTEVAIQMALVDMHEHIGQLIAYARTHKTIPPWSK